MGISSIGNSTYTTYDSLSVSSGNAANKAIEEKTKTQLGGLNAGTENISYAKSLTNITDSALGNISDYLQSMRELGIKAKNGTLSADEISSIQDQVNQYARGISDIASNTKFNEQNVIDGSKTDYAFATDNSGSLTHVTTTDASLSALGLDDLDVTSDDFIDKIDKALDNVNSSRSKTGAESNSLDYAWKQNLNSYENLVASTSDPLDDMVKTYQQRQREELLKNVKFIMQKKDAENVQKATTNLFI